MLSLISCITDPGVNAQSTTEKFGSNSYNTPQVAKELKYIEENIKPLTPKPTARILITGSTAGMGQLAAATLIAKGYKVVVHARNEARAAEVKRDLPFAEAVVTGDLSNPEAVKKLAADINALGNFDVIIHNAGTMPRNNEGSTVFNVNSLAPYILTALVHKPKRLVYVSSDLHRGAQLSLEKLVSNSPNISYADTKLQILTLAKAVAAQWKDVQVNAITPGWIPTKMGGESAPDDLRLGYSTLVWLAEANDKEAQVTNGYFFQSRPENNYNKQVNDPSLQQALLKAYERISGVQFPGN